MKFLFQKLTSGVYSGVLLTGMVVSQVCVMPVMADEAVNISDIKGCSKIAGDVERLSCYDTVSAGGVFNEQKLREVQVEEFGSETMPKEQSPAVTRSLETTTSPKAVPAPVAAQEDKKEVSADRLDVTIVRVKKGVGGIHYFQTSEGQVWKQQNATRWSTAVPFEAKIEKGMMNSFFLVNEGGKSTRVKRVK